MDPAEHWEKWGAISLSLVLNFVPDAKDRGEDGSRHSCVSLIHECSLFLGQMLRLARSMLLLGGLLFVAVCSSCFALLLVHTILIENSTFVAPSALYHEFPVHHGRTLRRPDGRTRF